MAERRMMAKSIIETDMFLDMPTSCQCLYFHLLLRADDDGFISNPKSIVRTLSASADDLKLLIAKQYLIGFESGVVVIKDWKIHNYIRNDRYKASSVPERELLNIRKDKAYTLKEDDGIPMINCGIPTDNQMDTNGIPTVSIGKVRLGKASIGKVRLDIEGECEKPHSPKRKTFTKPTIDEIQDYCIERNNNVNAEQFFDYYESNGWKVGKNSMKDWKAAVRTWERSEYRKPNSKKNSKEDAINVVNNLMNKLGGVDTEQPTTDFESTIDVTDSVVY